MSGRFRLIVEALAEAGPPTDRENDCVLCGAYAKSDAPIFLPESHEPDCPWRMAKEALA